MTLWNVLVLPLGLGLFGFIEPCTVGSSLLFVKYLEGRDRASKVRATLVFTLTRAVFIGVLGAMAAVIGAAFLDLQRGFWILLGALYIGLGALYLFGRQGFLMRTLGPALTRAGEAKGAAGLGVLFGLNIPACAAPLLGALLAATLGTAGVLQGFVALGVFGLALSLPLVAVVFTARGRRWFDRIAALSARMPFWTGVVFVVLGIWSVWFGLTVTAT